MFEYRGHVIRVIDGDTVVIDLDLGFRIHHKIVVRLAGIDAPEVVGATREAGLAAKRWVEEKLLSNDVVVRTLRNPGDKFGRWLAVVHQMVGISSSPTSLNDAMLAAGHAVPYDGGGK